jgi:hypothetical protein
MLYVSKGKKKANPVEQQRVDALNQRAVKYWANLQDTESGQDRQRREEEEAEARKQDDATLKQIFNKK